MRSAGCRSRDECRRTSRRFNQIESDMHNFYPSRKEINKIRGSSPFGIIKGETRKFGQCDFEFDPKQRIVEPPPVSRGNIARAMFYMKESYGLKIFTRQGAMLQRWHREDPPDDEELRRNDIIEKLQGTRNRFIDEPAKLREKLASSEEGPKSKLCQYHFRIVVVIVEHPVTACAFQHQAGKSLHPDSASECYLLQQLRMCLPRVEIDGEPLCIQSYLSGKCDQHLGIRGISCLQIIGLLDRQNHRLFGFRSLLPCCNHRTACRIGGASWRAALPKREIEAGTRYALLYVAPGVLQVMLHLLRHGLLRIRRQTAENTPDLQVFRRRR